MGLVECELNCAFFEFPDLVPGRAACVQDNGVALMSCRGKEMERERRLASVNKDGDSEKGNRGNEMRTYGVEGALVDIDALAARGRVLENTSRIVRLDTRQDNLTIDRSTGIMQLHYTIVLHSVRDRIRRVGDDTDAVRVVGLL